MGSDCITKPRPISTAGKSNINKKAWQNKVAETTIKVSEQCLGKHDTDSKAVEARSAGGKIRTPGCLGKVGKFPLIYTQNLLEKSHPLPLQKQMPLSH